ncbi:MAG: protein-ADP-ribose hydrolase [Clostridia bacterium]|nr:protein-ADP-ribose hydrolase [Clostridia bacterium]
MNQAEKRIYLINKLLDEGGYKNDLPKGAEEQKYLLRALFNVREPKPASEEFLRIQDEYLQEELADKKITDSAILLEKGDLCVWKGDITTLKADGIVNAANSKMLGCFAPCHGCIDNAIHTYAGVELRLECNEIMRRQGHDEPTGRAKITKAYNLPCKYVLHTVGPIVCGKLTEEHKKQLASCYESCLRLADEYGLESIAFCCISTGEFHFPNRAAAEIAVQTVKKYKKETPSDIKVVFNVFKDTDEDIYRELLGRSSPQSSLFSSPSESRL